MTDHPRAERTASMFRAAGLRRRMMISFGITFLVIAAVLNGFSWWSLSSGHEAVERLHAQTGHVNSDIAGAATSLSTLRTTVEAIATAGPRADQLRSYATTRDHIGELLTDIAADSDAPAVDATAGKLSSTLASLSAAVDQVAKGAPPANLRAIAAARTTEMEQGLTALVSGQDAHAAALMSDVESSHDAGRFVLIAIGVLTAIGALLMVLLVSRRLACRVERIAETVHAFADGDMSARTVDTGNDEIGQIATTFNTMAARLEASIGEERQRIDALNQAMVEVSAFADRVASGDLTAQLNLGEKGLGGFGLSTNMNRMVAGLAQISDEVKRGTHEISSSASQILATVSQHNSTTAEQAASITQTSVTIDEVRANSEQVAARAGDLAEYARRASTISDEGTRAVSELLGGMDKIGRRVDRITAEIRELAQRSQAIAEINETVTDLADQSNMLALNATIEAARAGEQGRGFAVVADQVRNLAEQSKQATAQVQAILQEIQVATAKAVSAADEGSTVVAEGRQSAGATGNVISQLGEAVRQTADVAVQIAAGAREQAVGMDQIGSAMEDVRQSTVEIASGAAHTESAAGSLNALADRLAAAASRYRIG